MTVLLAVSDFLFDDASWLVRWLVVDTSKWLSGRKVLLPVSALGHLDQKKEQFSVRLTMQQIKDSPDIDADRPVSRQMETHVYDYYGWRPYWGTASTWAATAISVAWASWVAPCLTGFLPTSDGARSGLPTPCPARRGDPHLRSVAAVTGYHIHAGDGEIGHVEDFFVEDADWSIHYLLVDTRNWWPGKKVLISPHSVQTIDWTHKLVNLNVDRRVIKDSPAYEPGMIIDRAYERHFHSYYGGVRPSHPT